MNRTGLKNHYINRIVKLSVIASAISLLLLNCSCSIDSVTDTGNSQSSETVTRITEKSSDKTIKLTMFSSTLGIEKSQDNEIRKLIAEKTGVEVVEVWLVGQTSQNVFDGLLQSKNLTDYVYFNERLDEFYEADLLVAWDPYIEQYPKIKSLYTDEEWDMLRQSDGHIYSVNIPGAPVWYGEDADETGLCNTAGFAVTTCCKDPDVAFKFINDILSDEVMELRFWGIEGVDYLVNVDGSYYRTKEMTDNLSEKEYVRDHVCQYQMMPQSRDFCV